MNSIGANLIIIEKDVSRKKATIHNRMRPFSVIGALMNLQAGTSFLLLFVLCEEFSKRKNNYDHHGQFDHRKTCLVFHFNSPKVSGPQPRLSIALRCNIHFDDQFLAAARLLTKRIADTQFDRKVVALPAKSHRLNKCNHSGYRKNSGKL